MQFYSIFCAKVNCTIKYFKIVLKRINSCKVDISYAAKSWISI